MDVNVYSYPPGDPQLIDKICHEFLSQGRFDKLRKECMANADTKPAYQNLQQRVENTVAQFLKKQTWKPDLNKNQLRDSVRKHILESGFLDAGINRIVDQVVNPHVLSTVFLPEVEEVVYNYLSIPRPADKQQKKTISALSDLDDNPPGVVDINDLKTENKIDLRNLNADSSRNEYKDSMRIEIENDNKEDVKNFSNISDGEFKCEKSKMNDSTESLFEKISNESLVSEEKSDIGLSDSKEKVLNEEVQPDSKSDFKVEPPSDDSQESLSRMGVERLQIIENDLTNGQDSDANAPLEIDERTMTDSQDSDDSILKQMSPISQGRLTPDPELKLDPEQEQDQEHETGSTPAPPPTRERLPILEEKNPLTFVGRIPKLKREDDSSNSSKKEVEKSDVKCVYSSDESESSKQSTNKSDSDKRSEEKKDEKSSKDKYKDEKKNSSSDKGKKREDKSLSSSSRDKRERSRDRKSRDEKSRSRKDSKDKDRRSDKSSSNDKKTSSSSHRSSSSHKSRHRDDSRSRDKDRSKHDRKDKDRKSDDKKKREDDKKRKSKSVDDHGKERKKREDRRSTDRDSNERERDKSSSTSKSQGEGSKRKEKEPKTDGSSKEKEQKGESDKKEEKREIEVDRKMEVQEQEQRIAEIRKEEKIEMRDEVKVEVHETKPEEIYMEVKEQGEKKVDVEVKPQNQQVKIEAEERKDSEVNFKENVQNENQVEAAAKVEEKEKLDSVKGEILSSEKIGSQVFSTKDLLKQGAIKTVNFREPTANFYQKFNSTGFRYFEDWEISCFDEVESQFKQFVQTAENNLSTLSDDESDNESEPSFIEVNRKIIGNSLNGLGNFESSLMFDPQSGEFYKWVNKKTFDKYLKENELPQILEGMASVKVNISKIEDDETQSIEEKNKENQEQNSRKTFQHRKSKSDKPKKPLAEAISPPEKPEMEDLIDNTQSSVIKILTEYEPDDKSKIPVETINDIVYKPKMEKDLPEKLIIKNFSEDKDGSVDAEVKKVEESNVKLQSVLERNVLDKALNVPDIKEEPAMYDEVEKKMQEMMGESIVDSSCLEESKSSNVTFPETPSSLPEDDKIDLGNKEGPKMDMNAKIRLFAIQSQRRSKNSNQNQKGCILARLSSTKSEECSDHSDAEHVVDSTPDATGNHDVNEPAKIVEDEGNKKTDDEIFSQPTTGCLGKRKMSQDNAESQASKIAKNEEQKSISKGKSVDSFQETKKRGIRVGLPRPRSKAKQLDGSAPDNVNTFNLPLSPESDDAILNDKGPAVGALSPVINKRKRAPFTSQNIGAIPTKRAVEAGKRRATQQKYDSQDLYKPRPVLTGSRTRNRSMGVTDSPSTAANGDQKLL